MPGACFGEMGFLFKGFFNSRCLWFCFIFYLLADQPACACHSMLIPAHPPYLLALRNNALFWIWS